MKKSSALFIAFMLGLISHTGRAQSDLAKLRNDHILKQSEKPTDLPLRESEVNIKAVRNFVLRYPEAQNVRWSKFGKYYVVNFTNGTVKVKVVYNNDGMEDYSLKMYNQNNLDRRIYSLVKSIYYDYEIATVEELRIKDKVIHLVHLSNPNYWKIIRISGNDFDEIESLRKK